MEKLEVGGIYKFIKGNDKIVIEVLQAHDDYYYMIKTRTHSLRPDMVGNVGQLQYDSKLFTEWEMEFLFYSKDSSKNDGFSIHPKKRLTKQEMEIEKLLTHVQRQVTKEHIMRAIDEALDAGNRNLFMVLTNQLNELEGVTA